MVRKGFGSKAKMKVIGRKGGGRRLQVNSEWVGMNKRTCKCMLQIVAYELQWVLKVFVQNAFSCPVKLSF